MPIENKKTTKEKIDKAGSPEALDALKPLAEKYNLSADVAKRSRELEKKAGKIETEGDKAVQAAEVLGGEKGRTHAEQIKNRSIRGANEAAAKSKEKMNEVAATESKENAQEDPFEKEHSFVPEGASTHAKEIEAQERSHFESTKSSAHTEAPAEEILKPIVTEAPEETVETPHAESSGSGAEGTEHAGSHEGNEGGPKNLEEARSAYFAAHEEFTAERKKIGNRARIALSWIKNIPSKYTRASVEVDDVKDPVIREKFENAQSAYNQQLVARGNEMINEKTAALIAEGKSPDEVESELKQFKIDTVFKELVLDEKQMLIDQEKEQLPSETRAKLGRILTAYSKLNKAQKFAVSLALGTGVALALAGGSALIATGSVGAGAVAGGAAVAKALSLKSLAVKLGTTVIGQTAGAAIGSAAVWAKDKLINFDGIANKAAHNYESRQAYEASVSEPMSEDVLNYLQKQYDRKLRVEAGAHAWKHRTDFIVRLSTSLGVGMAASHGLDNMLDSGAHINTDHVKAAPGTPANGHMQSLDKTVRDAAAYQPDPALDPAHASAIDHAVHSAPPAPVYEFKEIPEVKFSSAGGLQTALDLKRAVTTAYAGVDPSHIPPSYAHIMDPKVSNVDLAKELDWYRPDATDHLESVNVLKGSTITFNEGNVMSHSLVENDGTSGDDQLFATDGKHWGDTHERYFHAGQVHAAAPGTGTQAPSGVTAPPAGSFGPNTIQTNPGAGQGSVWGTNDPSAPQHIDQAPSDAMYYKDGGVVSAASDHAGETYWSPEHDSMYSHVAASGEPMATHNFHIPKAPQAAPADVYDVRQHYGDANSQMYRNYGGTNQQMHPIMNPQDPGHSTIDYQRVSSVTPRIEGQLAAMRLQPVAYQIHDNAWLEAHANDPAIPLYRFLHKLDQLGIKPRVNESQSEYIARAMIDQQSRAATLDVDTQDWLTRYGYFG